MLGLNTIKYRKATLDPDPETDPMLKTEAANQRGWEPPSMDTQRAFPQAQPFGTQQTFNTQPQGYPAPQQTFGTQQPQGYPMNTGYPQPQGYPMNAGYQQPQGYPMNGGYPQQGYPINSGYPQSDPYNTANPAAVGQQNRSMHVTQGAMPVPQPNVTSSKYQNRSSNLNGGSSSAYKKRLNTLMSNGDDGDNGAAMPAQSNAPSMEELMKQALLWLFGLEEYQLEEPAVKAGIAASLVLAAACIAVFIVLLAKKRLRLRACGRKVWDRTRLILQGTWR